MKTGGVGTKSRPETSASVRMGDSQWEERCLYFEARFGGSDTWHF